MSPIIDDLRIDAEIPPQSVRPGTAVEVALRFYNTGTKPRMLYFICEQDERHGHSMFVLDPRGPGPIVVQPQPRPNPHQPTAADFHELPPRGKLQLTQTLRVPADLEPGKHEVQWVYENRTDSLGGQPISGIWLGTLQDDFVLTVVPRRIGSRFPR